MSAGTLSQTPLGQLTDSLAGFRSSFAAEIEGKKRKKEKGREGEGREGKKNMPWLLEESRHGCLWIDVPARGHVQLTETLQP